MRAVQFLETHKVLFIPAAAQPERYLSKGKIRKGIICLVIEILTGTTNLMNTITDTMLMSIRTGAIDPSIFTTQRGIWAIKWSFFGLLTTALIQVIIVVLSGSVALLADMIHNFGDAATAIQLWIAFMLARQKPSKRFNYGYGRVEDLAGVVIYSLSCLVPSLLATYPLIAFFIHMLIW